MNLLLSVKMSSMGTFHFTAEFMLFNTFALLTLYLFVLSATDSFTMTGIGVKIDMYLRLCNEVSAEFSNVLNNSDIVLPAVFPEMCCRKFPC